MSFKRSSLRYGRTPPVVTPFQKAAQAWDERIGTPRVIARNWRLFAFGCLVLSTGLVGAIVWTLRSGATAPYVVEIDRSGAVRNVSLVADTYRPTDAQIAYHLARFVENVRGLSIDPVVVRANWLKAYDTVTDRAAITLNEHARDVDPFARIGQRTVTVDVFSIVRASDSSFQIRWMERSYDNSTLKETRTYTGLFSIQLRPPRSPEAIRKNPLGIYIHTFNWSADTTGDNR